jgi:hypothetical protein
MVRQRDPDPLTLYIDDDKSLLHISGLNDDVTSAADDQAPAIFHHGYQSFGAFDSDRAVERGHHGCHRILGRQTAVHQDQCRIL